MIAESRTEYQQGVTDTCHTDTYRQRHIHTEAEIWTHIHTEIRAEWTKTLQLLSHIEDQNRVSDTWQTYRQRHITYHRWANLNSNLD